MPPKKKLVTEYRWHRVPQYIQNPAEPSLAPGVDDILPDDSGQSVDVTIISDTTSTSTGSTPKIHAHPHRHSPPDDGTSIIDQGGSTYSYLRGLIPWSFRREENVADEVTDVVLNKKTVDPELKEVTEEDTVESEKRLSTWILVDDSGSDSDEEVNVNVAVKGHDGTGGEPMKSKRSSKHYQEVITINGEIPIEAVILPKDRARLDFNLFWKDVDKFLKEIPIFLDIYLRNWHALWGDGCRPWRVPTTVHSWWGEWGTFLSYFRDPSFWIKKYPSHLPGRYSWDSAISSHSTLEAYYAMRRRHKAPTHYSWACDGLDARKEGGNVLWSYCGYNSTPSKFDFEVMVEALPGDERLSSRCLLAYILSQPGILEKVRTAAHFLAWGRRRLSIHHYRDDPSLGGAYTDTIDLPWVTLHNKFPDLKLLFYENVTPLEWLVYRHCIEDDPNIDPDLDVVHAYTNYDPRGGEGAKNYYDGQQYIISDRFQEDYDQPSGDWWYHPRNYRYEMQRGIGHINDTFSRTRAPLYERMIELSAVGHASDPKPPWRKGSFQNLGWFLDQFQFHFLPLLRRTKVALDLVTRPFSYRETSLSRLDGTLFLLSRACRILSKKHDFGSNPDTWAEFKSLIQTQGEEVEVKMSALLTSLKPILKLLRTVHGRLAWASVKLEPAQSHWRILVGRSYYILGKFRLDTLHGLVYNRHFKDRYYGVPGLYSTSRHKRQLDPYNEYWLEQWPLHIQKKVTEGSQGHGDNDIDPDPTIIPGSETPPKPSFVPWDDAESVERVPWNLYWIGGDKGQAKGRCQGRGQVRGVHLHSPLEGRCVPLSSLGTKEKVLVFSSLYKNAQDILDISKDELDEGLGAIYKYRDAKDIVFMSPTGPVGPKDPGYQNLLRLMTNPDLVNPLDTTPLQPFDTLLDQWYEVVGQVASRKFRHMLGPGAYRLSQSLEQIFDLQQEVHLLLPHLAKLASFLRSNLALIRGLGRCESGVAVARFLTSRILRHHDPAGPLTSSLLRVKAQPFYVVRFSVGPDLNARLAQGLPGSESDSLTSVETALQGYYYIKNQRYEGYVSSRRERRGLSRGRNRLQMDRHRARMVGVEIRGQREREDYYRNRMEWRHNPVHGVGGVRRFSSANLFYLEDDRPELMGRYQVGSRYRRKDKMEVETMKA